MIHICPDELMAVLALLPGLGLVLARLKLWGHARHGCHHLPPVKTMPKYVIGETPSATWNYHLRQVEDGKVYPSGGPGLKALCGVRLGWDTKIPLTAWGIRGGHIPEKWCKDCQQRRTP